MDSQKAWDREYSDSSFVSKDSKPQADLLRFLKWVKKDQKISLQNLSVLDVGCGIGRNGFYMASNFNCRVQAFDFSKKAIEIAKNNFSHPNINFSVRDMAEALPTADSSVDLVLDIMASFALEEANRKKFLQELNRVSKPGGLVYLRTLAKEGDKNAGYLLKNNPASEKDTYIHPTLGSAERVFSRESIESLYSPFFDILFIERKTGYQRFSNQVYKRNYWNVYLKKHE